MNITPRYSPVGKAAKKVIGDERHSYNSWTVLLKAVFFLQEKRRATFPLESMKRVLVRYKYEEATIFEEVSVCGEP